MTHYLYISIEEHNAKMKELLTTIQEQEHLLQLGAVELRKLALAYDTIDDLTAKLQAHGIK